MSVPAGPSYPHYLWFNLSQEMTRKTADGAWTWLCDMRLSVLCGHPQGFSFPCLPALKGVRKTKKCWCHWMSCIIHFHSQFSEAKNKTFFVKTFSCWGYLYRSDFACRMLHFIIVWFVVGGLNCCHLHFAIKPYTMLLTFGAHLELITLLSDAVLQCDCEESEA